MRNPYLISAGMAAAVALLPSLGVAQEAAAASADVASAGDAAEAGDEAGVEEAEAAAAETT